MACEILVPWEGIRDLNHWTTQEWKECFLSGYPPALSARKEKCMWKSLSCVQLFGTPWTVQSMKLSRSEYIAFSRGSFQPRNQTLSSCISGRFFTSWATRKYPCKRSKKQCLVPILSPKKAYLHILASAEKVEAPGVCVNLFPADTGDQKWARGKFGDGHCRPPWFPG